MKSCVQYEPTKEPRVSREPWESTEPLEIKEEHDVAKTVQVCTSKYIMVLCTNDDMCAGTIQKNETS